MRSIVLLTLLSMTVFIACDGGCSGTETACTLASGDIGCCPYSHAECCADMIHCCPNGYVCDVSGGTCTIRGNNDFLSYVGIMEKIAPKKTNEVAKLETKYGFDFGDLIKCIDELKNLAKELPEVKELINDFKKGRWGTAVKRIESLISKGVISAAACIKLIK